MDLLSRLAGQTYRLPKDRRFGFGSLLSSTGRLHPVDFSRTVSGSGDSEAVLHDAALRRRLLRRQVELADDGDVDGAKHLRVDSLRRR